MTGGRGRSHILLLATTVVLLIAAAGCADSSDAESAGPTTTAARVITTTSTAEATTSTPAPASLQTDLGAIPAGYAFTSITSVGDQEALRIDGRTVDGATELHVSSSEALIHYAITADGTTWVRQDGDEQWVADEPLAVTDALEALRNPTAVRWLPGDADTNTYEADFEASVFGLASGGQLTLRIVTTPMEITYRYENGDAAVDVVVVPSADLTPIELPEEAATG